MRWSDLEFRFARPIHWLLALYGGNVVPFCIGNIQTGRDSYGHRFMAPDAFRVDCLDTYLTKAREHFVIVDPMERRSSIEEQTEQAAAAVGGNVLKNDDLLETVTFLA